MKASGGGKPRKERRARHCGKCGKTRHNKQTCQIILETSEEEDSE